MSIIKTKNNKVSNMDNNNGGEFRKINDAGFKEGMQSMIHLAREENCIDSEEILQDCLDNKYLTYKAVSILREFNVNLVNNFNLFVIYLFQRNIANGMNPIKVYESVIKELNSYVNLQRIINKYFIVNITDGFIHIIFTSDEEEVA